MLPVFGQTQRQEKQGLQDDVTDLKQQLSQEHELLRHKRKRVG